MRLGGVGGWGMFFVHCDADAGEQADDQQGTYDDEGPAVPLFLHALEVFDAVPFFVLPGPFPAFDAQDDGHDQTNVGNEGEQANPGFVANGPDPTEQKRPPRPATNAVWYGFFPRHSKRGDDGSLHGAAVGAMPVGGGNLLAAVGAKEVRHF